MNPKYSNIFWHEGVKIFEERLLDTAKGQLRVQHLENDVTKALLNVFEHGSPAILRSFLRMLQVKDAPESFALDFQVTDTDAYRRHPRRIMLTIKAADTPTRPDAKYDVKTSRPDGCIANDRTAILIEVKTQSPVVPKQIDSHIHHYLGTTTESPKTLTWEDISDNFRQLVASGKHSGTDALLLTNFLGLLEMLGIDRFNGFARSDFAQLDTVGRIPDEDFRDFKRQFRRKLEKFTRGVYEQVKDAYSFKPLSYRVEKGDTLNPFAWSALYFHDGDDAAHVNKYPNLNFGFTPTGLQFSVNAEMQPTVRTVLKRIAEEPGEFNRMLRGIAGMDVVLYYKVQYQPMDHFFWRLLPGFPLSAEDATAEELLSAVEEMKANWPRFLHTALYEMRSGEIRHTARRQFSESEIDYARKKSGRANFVFRLEKRYSIPDTEQAARHIIRMVAGDVRDTAGLLRFLVDEEGGRR